MTMRLHAYSFHSVKGGVGKSTLSTLAATHLARARPDIFVYLVDMDLTGTSLADVLPLEAPSWGEADTIDLLTSPVGFCLREKARERVEERQESLNDDLMCQQAPDRRVVPKVPFLNDFFLYATPDWDSNDDVAPSVISWRMQGGPEKLRVLPSSALPADLERTLPLIFDEERAAFLEARLEHLLAAILQVHEAQGEVAVVFDTPPTIPGLSRSIMSLAFRLGKESKVSLADDGYFPPPLGDARIDWRAFLVATTDWQDLRAAARWLFLVTPEERKILKPLLNRAPKGDPTERNMLLERALHDIDPSVFADRILVEENLQLQFFREERVPPELAELMGFIEARR